MTIAPPRPALLLALSLFACQTAPIEDSAEETASQKRRELPFEMVEGEPMYQVLPAEAIPAIDEPVFVDAQAADAFLATDEPVLGVVGRNGTAKCYSAWHLDAHEIVNDEVDGEPIAATW